MELKNFCRSIFEFAAVFFCQVREFKRLQTALGGPHGKQHGSFAADGAAADVKHHLRLDTFIQRLFQVEQSAGKGKLVQAGADLASVFQPDQSQNRSQRVSPAGHVARYQYASIGA